MTFYNSKGKPIAYLETMIQFTFYWRACSLFQDDAVYGFNGKHLGWSNLS